MCCLGVERDENREADIMVYINAQILKEIQSPPPPASTSIGCGSVSRATEVLIREAGGPMSGNGALQQRVKENRKQHSFHDRPAVRDLAFPGLGS